MKAAPSMVCLSVSHWCTSLLVRETLSASPSSRVGDTDSFRRGRHSPSPSLTPNNRPPGSACAASIFSASRSPSPASSAPSARQVAQHLPIAIALALTLASGAATTHQPPPQTINSQHPICTYRSIDINDLTSLPGNNAAASSTLTEPLVTASATPSPPCSSTAAALAPLSPDALAAAAARMLASPDSIRESFRSECPISPTHPGVSIKDARQTFAILVSHPRSERILTESLDRLLRRPGRPLRTVQDALFLYIIVEIPDLVTSKVPNLVLRNDLLSRIFGLMSSLDKRIHQSFVAWLSQLPIDLFRRRVDMASQFITYRLTKDPVMYTTYMHDWGIRAAARVLALLFTSNQTRSDRIATTNFYNTPIDYIDVYADYQRWQQPGQQLFSFCQYPFLISLGSKMLILEKDAREQMIIRFRDAFLRTTVQGVATDPFLTISVRRSHLIEDSLNQLQAKLRDLKKKLRIEFSGEEGVDAGGLTKEWFLLLVRELFDPQYGMFVYDEDSHLCWFNVASLENDLQFHLVGIVVGLSLYNTTILDIRFPLACFKKLLNVPVGLEDLKVLQPSLGRGLQQLLDYDGDDVEDVFSRSFIAEYESFGAIVQEPLIPNGDVVAVTRSNRGEFVSLYVDWILSRSISRQFDAFKDGFYQVCGGNALSLFRPDEIEAMVRGSTTLDLEGLQLTTELDGFQPDDPVVSWFWTTIHGLTDDMKRSFLLFTTGTDRVPATGIETLTMKLSCLGPDSDRLPVAHTCFNQIGLYRYASRDKLQHKLVQAIQWSSGFLMK